ncbi:hypothetical protein [Thauera propionica]|uniref:hypothetical protein n=1 Tax=Thauera propionica TaxID=2019431 RepID=UPI0023F2553D|nr:hypothetical protein [Thauera propionica]MDD3675221.1 hypothetical protein [Thauera propionica]
MMNAYFDIRNGHIAIVETDTPEPGWIKLTSKQSRLAARYRLDEDGKVIDAFPGKTDEEVLAAIAEQQAAQAQPTASAPRVLTKLQFLNRFTNEELAAVYTAAKTNVLIEVFLDKLKLAQEVNLDDPQTVDGLQALAAAGLLSEARVQEVLA